MSSTRRLDAAAVTLVLAGLILTWLGRTGEVFAVPTTVVSYADLALVPLAMLLSFCGSGRYLRPRWLVSALAAFAVVGVVSALLNGLPVVQAGVGVMLYAEPFVAVYVLMGSSVPWLRPASISTIVAVLCVQLPFAVYQWIVEGPGDPVQGTLAGSGAGAHVLGSGMLLGIALLLASPARFRPWSVALVVIAIGVTVVADAKQVWAMLPLVVVVMFLQHSAVGRRVHNHRKPARFRVVGGVLLLSVLAVPVGTLVAKTYVGNIIVLTAENRGGKLAVAEAVTDDLASSVTRVALGLGPGQTVSRLAWMRSPVGGIESSPLRTLGIEPSIQTLTYHDAALSRGFVGESSVSYALSSALGVVGDFGLLGASAYVALLGGVLLLLWRCHDPLASAALGVWAALLTLCLISDWLEQTPITLMVAVVSGVALAGGRSSSTADPEPVLQEAKG